MDGDTLDASNLHRQTLYTLQDTGRPKVLLAAERLRALNPEVDVRPYAEHATRQNLGGIAAGYDVIVDCSADNFPARFLVNDVAVTLGKPAVLASVYQYEGQLQVVSTNSACLRCLWPDGTRDGTVGNCAQAGVLGPVPACWAACRRLRSSRSSSILIHPLAPVLFSWICGRLESQHLKAKRSTNCPEHCETALRAE
jgi:adenylyltransferase/sulfurtransferase